jgi:hypothetical protein
MPILMLVAGISIVTGNYNYLGYALGLVGGLEILLTIIAYF